MVLFVTSNISECQFVDQITYQFDPTKLQVRKHSMKVSGGTGSCAYLLSKLFADQVPHLFDCID